MPVWTSPECEAFGLRLRELREGADVNQGQLADWLGEQSQSVISDWERGKRQPPNAKTVLRIEELLGAAPGSLSQVLGFVPTSALDDPPPSGVIEAVIADEALPSSAKSPLLNLYRELTSRPPSGGSS